MNNLSGRVVAIVGGAGFIGHNLALALAAAGAEPHVVDSLQVNNLLSFASGHGDSARRDLDLRILHQRLDLLRAAGIPPHTQDARDYHALSRILSDIKPQVIVHLAAVAHANRSNKDPFSTFDHSLRTLENSLDYARAGGIERFVFLSSSMAYGNFRSESVTEEHPLEPIGIYGALKLAGEKMVIAYEQVFKLPYTIVRPSALYGPRCVSRRVIQVFIENAMEGKAVRMTGDGSERLDFTYIDDLVNGIMGAVASPAAANEIFNLTCGNSRSIAEVVDILRAYFPDLRVETEERDALMPIRGTLEVGKAERLFGYRAEHPIDIGVPKYVEWYKELYGGVRLTASV